MIPEHRRAPETGAMPSSASACELILSTSLTRARNVRRGAKMEAWSAGPTLVLSMNLTNQCNIHKHRDINDLRQEHAQRGRGHGTGGF
ncbi:hypothetical protein C5Y93_27135 [Blastopirellula marina]|uniref:Uncharacterized protein n=1 Tax=Blastopirellula marina TaxID=124 RepID=A0A2S8GD77_9BACT|nr:hypothetical protein C5Y93_27135 [Blastopirellula marina]